ncbi:hypothetical protein ABZ554_00670 [Streptomyces sp. NPDC020125]|uniref:hypothetical protein n=1 Tax=Streptomyces sp. NPDC020125 TaxID=3154593 RepID=UPI0034035C7A
MLGDGLAREGTGRHGPGPRDCVQQLRTSVLDPRKAAGLGLLLVPSQLRPPCLPERTIHGTATLWCRDCRNFRMMSARGPSRGRRFTAFVSKMINQASPSQ